MKFTATVILLNCLASLQATQASRKLPSVSLADQNGYSQASSELGGRPESQCEKIGVSFCNQMPYLTRMPNFFEDSTQSEAADRALFYQNYDNMLRCSPHLHTYLCEIITPVCIEKSPVTRIFPCRSFCRDIRRDCEDKITRGSLKLQEAFVCENLPYEFNGGNGTEGYGPCHETPGHQDTRTEHTGYRPYNEEQDTNVPPFITDTSRIESSLIKPMPPRVGHDPPPTVSVGGGGGGLPTQPSTPRVQPVQQSWWHQVQNSLQFVAFNLTKYSNILSIITVICLLLVLNSKRLKRLSWRLRGLSPSSSTASSTSARQLQKSNHPGAGGASSPSSSSRSLVLFAGTGKQPPTHHLLGPEEPQKLIHGLNQKTLVNINSTLERQTTDRYLLLTNSHVRAAADKQKHLFGTMDSESSSNQYDYIQIDTPTTRLRQQQQHHQQQQQQQSQQMYSNILLSSPSHQVLLMQQQQQHGDVQQLRVAPTPTHPAPPPPVSGTPGALRHTQMPGYSSGYADPLNQRSFQRRARTSSSRSTRLLASGSSVSSGSSSGEQRPARMPL